MDGVHDLGGGEGFGAVVAEPDEPVFHHDWERRMFGLNFAAVPTNVDKFRHAIERLGAVEYLTTSYYEHWLAAVETLAVETGVIDAADLERARAAAVAGEPPPRRDDPDHARMLVAAVQSPSTPDADPGDHAFGSGDRVRVRRAFPHGHTRCPRYVRGAPGTIEAVRGRFRLPDASAAGDDRAEPLYSVVFRAADLWGAGDHEVALDLWEPYLESPDG